MVTMSSSEFTRICRELYSLNETVNIETTKELIVKILEVVLK